jgi:hypothetical protein
VRRVKIGPSIAKVPLDLLLAVKALHVALKWKFDYIHSHEEGGAIGLVLSRLLRVPHLYDMHSSLPEQLSNFKFSRSRLLVGAFRALERLMVSRSSSVIVICRHLEEVARAIAPGARGAHRECTRLRNADATSRALMSGPSLACRPAPMVLYTARSRAQVSTSFAAMPRARLPDTRLIPAGGHAD